MHLRVSGRSRDCRPVARVEKPWAGYRKRRRCFDFPCHGHIDAATSQGGAPTQRYELASLVSVLALTGIVALFNYVIVQSDVVADLTASEQYTLAPQTLDILTERLDAPVEATAFIVDDSNAVTPLEALIAERMVDYLREFERRSGGRFSYQVIDPERFPDIAYSKEVTQWPSVVFENANAGTRQKVGHLQPDRNSLPLSGVGGSARSPSMYGRYSSWDLTIERTLMPTDVGFALRGLEGDSYSGVLYLIEDPRIPASNR